MCSRLIGFETGKCVARAQCNARITTDRSLPGIQTGGEQRFILGTICEEQPIQVIYIGIRNVKQVKTMEGKDKPSQMAGADGVQIESKSDVDVLPTSPEEVKAEKRRIVKNILLISFAFLCVFTAFQGLSRLQSSLHRIAGMGVINLSILYAALVLSCLFVPKLLISAIGHKWTIPLSFSGYIIWMAANGYATWWTLIPASIIVGVCAAPLWTAQCSYFTKIAGRYAALTGDPEDVIVTRFFGIFFMFFQMCEYLPNAQILKPDKCN